MVIEAGQKMYAADILNLTFFPKGAILTFSTEAWNNATNPGFKDIWKICDGQNGTPNLVNMFLRGGSSSGATGGADSRSVTLTTNNLPAHGHGATGLELGTLSLSPLSLSDMAISELTVSGGTHEHTLSGGASASVHSHTGSGATSTGSGAHPHTVSGSTSNTSKTLTSDSPYFQMDYARKTTNNTNGIITSTTQIQGSTDDGNGHDTCASFHIDATHTHDISGATPGTEGAHSHDVSVTITDSGSHTHDFTSDSKAVSISHEHTITGGKITGKITGGSITGGGISGSTANAGSGQAFSVDTVPAYYTVIYIMKVV
jgi:hypothetical protein